MLDRLELDDHVILKKKIADEHSCLHQSDEEDCVMTVKQLIDFIGRNLSALGWISQPSED